MRFKIVKYAKKSFQWKMETNNVVVLAASRNYTRKSDCLRAIEKHFGVLICKFKTSNTVVAFRGTKRFATIIDKTK